MGLLQKNEADNFLGVSGFWGDLVKDIEEGASETFDKVVETGKKAIGLDTGKGGGGTDTVVTPTQTTEAPKKSNTVLYVGIGAGVLLVGWLLLRKPKKKGK